MKIHELNEVVGSQSKKRVGRGIAAGGGKTAGRGTKGQKSRTGKKLKVGFEGGQTKLASRLPKVKGFKPRNRVPYEVVNLSDLATIKSTTIDKAALHAANLIRKENSKVKLLGDGTVEKAYKIQLDAVSASAKAAVEKAGGSIVEQKPVAKPAKDEAQTK